MGRIHEDQPIVVDLGHVEDVGLGRHVEDGVQGDVKLFFSWICLFFPSQMLETPCTYYTILLEIVFCRQLLVWVGKLCLL